MDLSLTPQKNGPTNKILIIIGIVFAVLILAYVVVAYTLFASRYIPGTVIDNINCGFKTETETSELLSNAVSSYSLEITDGKITDTITASDISLSGNFGSELKAALDSQNRLIWGIGIFKSSSIETAPVVSFDETALNTKIEELELVSGASVTDSTNARLELDENNEFVIIPETYGTRLDMESFTARVTEAVNNLETKLDLTEGDFYIKPTVYKDGEAINTAMNTANKWLQSVITYQFGSNTEVVDSSLTKDWIVIGDDFSTYFDRTKVTEYVRSLSKKYDTFGDTRTLHTTYGFDVSVAGGNYGYRINREAEIDNLVADIKTGESKQRTPDYYQEGASYDGLDIGSTYVEIDLTGQHLFLYKDGKVVLQTEIVSGHPKKGVTPNGTYRITYCERDATLVGENYETPVAYWMPFNGDIGMHDATWQPTFGGDWYVNHGSHGCINLPLSVAAQIYSYAYTGMPVVCYRYNTSHYNAVNNYRTANGLNAIFDTQPTSAETETTTAAAQ